MVERLEDWCWTTDDRTPALGVGAHGTKRHKHVLGPPHRKGEEDFRCNVLLPYDLDGGEEEDLASSSLWLQAVQVLSEDPQWKLSVRHPSVEFAWRPPGVDGRQIYGYQTPTT